MNALKAGNSDPIYDHSSDPGVLEAKFDLLYKLCNYLVFRLEMYSDNLQRIKMGQVKQHSTLITERGFLTLFNTNPLETDYIPRKLCIPLEILDGSFRNFWTGFCRTYYRLQWVTSPLPGQPKHLLKKHFQVMRYMFGYLRYINDSVSTKFGEFREYVELQHFLKLLVHTQYLLGDLLDFSVTTDLAQRGALRQRDTNLRNLCNKISSFRDSWLDYYMDARGTCNDEIQRPDEVCANGDYLELNFMDTHIVSGF